MKLDDLVPEFREKVELLLARLSHRGVTMQPYCTIREPFEQAKLWRQSRTSQEIKTRCASLRAVGAPRIAACIESVEPLTARQVTNAAPGFSWHQFGEAVDCVLVVAGHAEWNATAAGWITYVVEAKMLGLKCGADFGDTPHIQLRHEEPHHMFEMARLDNMLSARFSRFAALGGKGA